MQLDDDGILLDASGQLSRYGTEATVRDGRFTTDSELTASTSHHDEVDDVREFERLEAAMHRQNFDVDDELISISERRSSTQTNTTDNDGTPVRLGICIKINNNNNHSKRQ